MASASRTRRGALIVFEGCDKVGKSTQCRKLVESLKNQGTEAEAMSFPDRTTLVGKQIDAYLKKKVELEDHTVHLLFSANRWEMVPEMMEKLQAGVSLVVDRYAFSGVAFTSAKKIAPLSWCKCPDIGLPAPDVVFYLDLLPEAARTRQEYGSERYEKADFQRQVRDQFNALKEESWRVLDASRTIDELHHEVLKITREVINEQASKPIAELWQTSE